jgi:alpha-2-macroglobulin
MKKIATLVLLPVCFYHCFGQNNLSGSKTVGQHTLVYKISPQQAVRLYQNHLSHLPGHYLHTLIDSIKNNTVPIHLTSGNYLLVDAQKNNIRYQLYSAGQIECRFVNNEYDLAVVLHTKGGKLITDALVYIDGKKIPYHKATQTYRLPKRENGRTVLVYYQNTVYTFPTSKNKKPYAYTWKKIASSFPLKYISNTIKRKRNKQSYYTRYDFFYNTRYEKKFKGFLVFSKPIYRPGDTVKLKVFVVNRRGNAINKSLLIRLSSSSFYTDTILATIKPYRKGGYDYFFVLNDPLDLDLDDDYFITLEALKSRKYDINSYEGDLDEEEYAAKRKVLIRGKFHFEEYELKSIQFNARVDKGKHGAGESPTVYLKATDENELAVFDGRVNISVTVSKYSSKTFHQPRVFLPDTLWQHSQAMDPLGETKITLPNSIFPPCSFDYEINCRFLNSNNEERAQTLHQQFEGQPYRLQFENKNDSIHISIIKNGRLINTSGIIVAINNTNDTIGRWAISFPGTIKTNTFASQYAVQTEELNETFKATEIKPDISCSSFRTSDSVFLQVSNPNQLYFWYTIFGGNKVVQQGYTNSLLYQEKTITKKNYFISIEYLYDGIIQNRKYFATFRDRMLNINVDQPAFVYPGQKAKVDITVTDINNKPVANADVTAYAFTKKFENAPTPYIPYLGKQYGDRKRFRNFYGIQQYLPSLLNKMNWERWSREMRLDTIEYYRFLHPKSIYVNSEPAKDSITQIAPFVVWEGELQPVHHIYIDEKPVFFSQTQHLQRYSFEVSAGRHSLRLRMQKQMITLDSFVAERGMKTFLCINADSSNKAIRIQKMPDTLTAYEKAYWSKYLLVINNSFGNNMAYVRQNNKNYLFHPGNGKYSYQQQFLTGPFYENYSQLHVLNKFSQDFTVEGSNYYTITPQLIKQKEYNGRYLFNTRLPFFAEEKNFKDEVLTVTEIDRLLQNYLDMRSRNEDLFNNKKLNAKDNGSLQIDIKLLQESELNHLKEPNLHSAAALFIKNILIFKYDEPDFLRIYKGNTHDFGYLAPGLYRIAFLLKHNHYFIQDSVLVKPNGINYYTIHIHSLKTGDSISNKIANIIQLKSLDDDYRFVNDNTDIIKETFNAKFLATENLTHFFSGKLISNKNLVPIIAASVRIKGTRLATITDASGHFSIRGPKKTTLIFSAVGFETAEINLNPGAYKEVILSESVNRLNEVVVIGYGSSRKKDLTGAVTTISASSLAGNAAGIIVRGVSSFSNNNPPLILVDGIPFAGNLQQLDSSKIVSITILKDEQAIALYGSAASGGVIIINTKKIAVTENDVLNTTTENNSLSIRKNFSDVAYWQPQLKTNKQGKVSFTTNFPDDITNWRSRIIAIDNNKRTGFMEKFVKSFRQVSGNLMLPAFLTEGDSVNIIGKALNYSPDSITLHRTFTINKTVQNEEKINFRNSFIDTFSIVVNNSDSMQFSYSIQKPDGYFDGEERTLPLFKQGSRQTKGVFTVLDADTSFLLNFTDSGKTTIYAETHALPVLLNEIEQISNYQYLCNEQLASKLKALLLKKKIYSYQKQKFEDDKAIHEIINRLNQNKVQLDLWGWWNNNEPLPWISLHVIETLLLAEKEGYASSLNKTMVADYLLFQLESYNSLEKLHTLKIVQLLHPKANITPYIDSLTKWQNSMSLYNKLQLLYIKQQQNIPITLDSFINKASKTVFGNIYWGEENYQHFDNAIQNTLLMYRLLKSAGTHNQLLPKIRNYFLEKRSSGAWRNTYESALILETILPDLLQQADATKAPTLVIQHHTKQEVINFPFKLDINAGTPINITKTGSGPVYFTAYQQYWNSNPAKYSGNFEVTTVFEKNGSVIRSLKAGEQVVLKTIVSVMADAEYVMVEVPVPAGCSYVNKEQSWTNNEVHREYFKNKVSIFCRTLTKGNYTFTISLLPRFTGSFTMNPAKAEMMYFPVFYGSEAIKKIPVF